MKRVALITTLALTCVFTACKKDKEQPKTTTELLTAKTWKITAKTKQVDAAAPTDEYAATGACLRDNTYKFEVGNTFVADEGAIKCLPVQTFSGSWSLNKNDKELTVLALDQPSGFFVSFHGTLEEISASKFVLVETDGLSSPIIVTRTTFTAQ
ncbi:hypothetical protein EJV47_02690 [Hymenobacter gummosus]|uniref:Lipocalin-like domain-containing protein n=1 Tax=Hymenobacter gummosus TaxID=1776032 RepID=A0A3S0HAJ6_9BACT|nr:hypothetical protein [Hymenobacter gummosus]RTQ53661.1 hypothetical protein EJV47_02690 [Hymenobacter gummosus]